MEISKKIGAYIIIITLILMMLYSVTSFLLPKIVSKFEIDLGYINNLLDIKEKENKNIDWKEKYKFESKQSEQTSKVTLIDKYKNKVYNITNKLEKATSENLIEYEKIVELSYIYEKMINYSLLSNSSEASRVELDNGYLTRIVPKHDVKESANRLIELKNYLDSIETEFLYVQAPYKVPKNDKSISTIYKDYSNSNMDTLLKQLDGKVNYIDIRENIQDENISHVNLFFKTDHHWLPTSGLWATNQISKYLNNNYDMKLKIENSNIENYTINTYENTFLGSDGKHVTMANANPEDFELLIPNFDTQLDVKILDEGIDKEGTYIETLINTKKLENKNYYTTDQYSAYSYGTKALIEVNNKLVQNNKKILLIRDSFSNVVVPFLALETEYLSAIDLRYFTGSLKTYIKEYQPDMVIVMYTGNHYANFKDSTDELWEFE